MFLLMAGQVPQERVSKVFASACCSTQCWSQEAGVGVWTGPDERQTAARRSQHVQVQGRRCAGVLLRHLLQGWGTYLEIRQMQQVRPWRRLRQSQACVC